jgi:hypothetical protein
MLDAPALIALIESSKHGDPAALDEIDVQVCAFLGHPLPLRYTRSRDVLKAIRPEGFKVKIECWPACVSVMGGFLP